MDISEYFSFTASSDPELPSTTPMRQRSLEQESTNHQDKQCVAPMTTFQSVPKDGEVFTGSNFAVGKGLGVISSKFFEPETWTPLLRDTMGRGRYGQFITAMIGRIKLQESNPDEVRNFVNLVASDVNHDLMSVALPHMPNWEDEQ